MARIATVFLAALAMILAPAALAEEAEPGAEGNTGGSSSATPAVSAAPPQYQLPKVGKPRRRVGGGRRGPGEKLPDVYAVVPEHVGLTVSEQPTLYWYLSESAQGEVQFELTLIDEKSIDPLVDARIGHPPRPGLQQIRLADHGVKLAPGQEYQWAVSLVPNPEHRSQDVVSTGWIERVAPSEGLSEELARAGADGAAAVYARAGLWYDALAAAGRQAQARPDDPQARAALESLLEQVSLPAVSAAAE